MVCDSVKLHMFQMTNFQGLPGSMGLIGHPGPKGSIGNAVCLYTFVFVLIELTYKYPFRV